MLQPLSVRATHGLTAIAEASESEEVPQQVGDPEQEVPDEDDGDDSFLLRDDTAAGEEVPVGGLRRLLNATGPLRREAFHSDIGW
jgi:hypothetical protein